MVLVVVYVDVASAINILAVVPVDVSTSDTLYHPFPQDTMDGICWGAYLATNVPVDKSNIENPPSRFPLPPSPVIHILVLPAALTYKEVAYTVEFEMVVFALLCIK